MENKEMPSGNELPAEEDDSLSGQTEPAAEAAEAFETIETVEGAAAGATTETVVEEPQFTPPPVTEVGAQPSILERFSHWLLDKETSRGRFLRSALRWTAVALAAFVVGLVVFYFWQYRPLQARLQDTQTQLGSAQADAASLQGDLDEANAANEDLTAANLALEEDVRIATARVLIAQIQGKALNARLQLNIRQGAAAQKSLREAKDLLADLDEVLGEDSAQVLEQMETRLAAATSSLISDPTVAIKDLETFDTLLAQQEIILSK